MQTNVTAFGAVNKDDLIVTALSNATPMLHRIACDLGHFLGYDFDDLYQMAAVLLLENFDKVQWDNKPVALLARMLRCDLVNSLRVRLQVMSLDAPLGDEEDSGTLLDVLVVPGPVEKDEQKEDNLTSKLYAALKRLPLETQMYLRRVNDLNAYNPVLPVEGRYAGQRPNYDRSGSALSAQGYRALRTDKVLAATYQ